MNKRKRVSAKLLALLVLAACSDGGTADPELVGTYSAERIRGLGDLAEFELVLEPRARASLRMEFADDHQHWQGDWEMEGEFILLRLWQVGLDPAMLRKSGITQEDLQEICYFWLVLRRDGELSLIEEAVCHCEEDPGDLRDFLARARTKPMKLSRVEDDPRSK